MDKLLDPLYVLFHILALVVLVLVLKKLLYKPMKKLMAQRREALEAETAQADAAYAKAKETEAEIDRKTQEYNERTKNEYYTVMKDANAKAELIVAAAHEEAEKIVAEAKEQAEAVSKAAFKQQQEAAAELAVEISARLIPHELSQQDHAALLEQSLEEAKKYGL